MRKSQSLLGHSSLHKAKSNYTQNKQDYTCSECTKQCMNTCRADTRNKSEPPPLQPSHRPITNLRMKVSAVWLFLFHLLDYVPFLPLSLNIDDKWVLSNQARYRSTAHWFCFVSKLWSILFTESDVVRMPVKYFADSTDETLYDTLRKAIPVL